MSPIAYPSSTVAGAEGIAVEARSDERLPLPQAVLVIGSASVILWIAIGFGVSWLLA